MHTYILASIVALLIYVPGFAHAQSDAIKAARKAVIQSIANLSSLETADLSQAERATLELKLKRGALSEILNLSSLETVDLKEKLEAIDNLDEAFFPLRDELAAKLGEYVVYIAEADEKVEEAATVTEIQELAGDFKDWREMAYSPDARKGFDVVIAFQNRGALEIAEQRIAKLSSEFKTRGAKSGWLKSQDELWRTSLAGAAANLKDARSLNDRALEIVSSYIPKPEGIEAETAGGDAEVSVAGATVRELVEGSIGKLKEAYQKFISLTEALNTAAR
jgi:hypothetical protein